MSNINVIGSDGALPAAKNCSLTEAVVAAATCGDEASARAVLTGVIGAVSDTPRTRGAAVVVAVGGVLFPGTGAGGVVGTTGGVDLFGGEFTDVCALMATSIPPMVISPSFVLFAKVFPPVLAVRQKVFVTDPEFVIVVVRSSVRVLELVLVEFAPVLVLAKFIVTDDPSSADESSGSGSSLMVVGMSRSALMEPTETSPTSVFDDTSFPPLLSSRSMTLFTVPVFVTLSVADSFWTTVVEFVESAPVVSFVAVTFVSAARSAPVGCAVNTMKVVMTSRAIQPVDDRNFFGRKSSAPALLVGVSSWLELCADRGVFGPRPAMV